MKYLSICSGVEAATVAWHHMGWKPVGFSEIEPFPSAVLKHHYPNVPNYGDMTTIPDRILSGEIEAPDLLVGGTPCQAFSIAGLRNSLEDARGNLSLVFIRIANATDHVRAARGQQPCIILWENVPGVYSTKDNAFGSFLAGLADEDTALQPPGGKWTNAGAVFSPKRAVAWRTLDAQYFGVAQRRRRCFVVASARTGFDPSKVLFEFEGVRRDIAPSRSAGQDPAKCLTTGVGQRYDPETESLIPQVFEMHPADSRVREMGDVCQTVTSRWGTGGGNVPLTMQSHPLVLEDQGGSVINTRQDGTVGTLRAQTHGHEPSVISNMAVRRLTPIECERLQGFPDNYTNIPWRKKPESPDSPRYKAMGNSMAVPVMRWIGERIQSAVLTAHNDNQPNTLAKTA